MSGDFKRRDYNQQHCQPDNKEMCVRPKKGNTELNKADVKETVEKAVKEAVRERVQEMLNESAEQ